MAQSPSYGGTGLSRRAVLVAATVAIGGSSAGLSPGAPAIAIGHAAADFMRLSALLIPHRLSEVTGQRLMVALGADRPPFSREVAALLALAVTHQATAAEDFFPFATVPAKTAALAIISAWYLGVVDDVPGAQVFANHQALMFGPTSDVMTIPTYAIAGPSEWGPASAPLAFMPVF